MNKSQQIQIRVSAEQKRRLRKLAREAGTDMSAWVLSRVLPDEAERFQELVVALGSARTRQFALAELADYLRSLPPGAFQRAVSQAPRPKLDQGTLNHLAAAIELAAARRAQAPPAWTRQIPIPAAPEFGSTLFSLQLYLLTRSPVALRRRNLFMDASIDDRV
ncbi:MAG: hypothetical protein ACT443_02890 [Gemmatimonadota bacterium]